MHKARDAEKLIQLGNQWRTQKSIDLEYADCRKVEAEFSKQIRKLSGTHSVNWKKAVAIIWQLCDAVGGPHIKRVFFQREKVSAGAYAHYEPREKAIYFSFEYVPWETIVHEVTHNWVRNHGKDFCDLERLLFEVLVQILQKEKKKEMGLDICE